MTKSAEAELKNSATPGMILPGCSQNTLCDRMLAMAFHGRRQPEHFVFGGVVENDNVRHAESTLGQRTGLVEDDGIEVLCSLEGRSVPN